jgi:hypothetical protein
VDEIIKTLTQLAPLVSAILIPLVGGVIIPLLTSRQGPQDPAAVRSMKLHAKLHESLPPEAQKPIQSLLEFESAKYARALMKKGARKLNGGSVAALILVGLVVGGLAYGLTLLGMVWWPGFIILGVEAVMGVALMVIGAGQLYDYEDVPDPLAPTVAAGSSGDPRKDDAMVSTSRGQSS